MKNILLMILIFFLFSCQKEVINQEKLTIDMARPKTGDKTPPTVDFIYPKNGDIVSGVITVNLSASDASGIKQTNLMITNNSTGLNCLFGISTTAPYNFVWDTHYICDGATLKSQTATLRAVATDNAGNSTFKDITITISN